MISGSPTRDPTVAERYVLGAAMGEDPAKLRKLCSELSEEHFADGNHRDLFGIIRDTFERGDPMDASTLAGQRVHSELVAEIYDANPGMAGALDFHISALHDAHRRRQLAGIASDLAREAKRDDVDFADLIRGSRERLDEIKGLGGEDGMAPLVCALDAPPAEPIQWEVPPIIPRHQLGAIVGEGGAGKDTFALALLLARAGGYAPLDHMPFRGDSPQPVVYVSEEDSRDTVLGRAEAIIRGHGWDRDRVLRNFHFLALAGVSLDSDAWIDHLISEVKRLGASLVILGPLRDMTTAEENSNSEMAAVIQRLRRLSTETGAAVGIIHHAGKPIEGKRKLDRVRGASALKDAARWILWVERHESGMLVDHIKMNGAELHPAFVVERDIQVSQDNPGMWSTAGLRYVDRRQAARSGAEDFVLELLAASPQLNSTEIRRAASDEKISPTDASEAMKILEARGDIHFEPGPHNSKLWSLHPDMMQGDEDGACMVASPPAYAGSTEGPDLPALPLIEDAGSGASGSSGMQETQGDAP